MLMTLLAAFFIIASDSRGERVCRERKKFLEHLRNVTVFMLYIWELCSTTRRLIVYFWFIFNCSTREIKPNQTDIGRKITKKPTAITPSPYNRTTTSGQTSSSTPNSLANGKRPLDSSERGPSSSDGQQKPSLQSSTSHLTSQQQLSAPNSHSYNATSFQDHHHDSYHHNLSALNGVVGDDVDHQRNTSSMGHNLSRNTQQNHRITDIMKKPIKWVAAQFHIRLTCALWFIFFSFVLLLFSHSLARRQPGKDLYTY